MFNEAQLLYVSIPDTDRQNAHEYFMQHGLAHDLHEAVELVEVVENDSYVEPEYIKDEDFGYDF